MRHFDDLPKNTLSGSAARHVLARAGKQLGSDRAGAVRRQLMATEPLGWDWATRLIGAAKERAGLAGAIVLEKCFDLAIVQTVERYQAGTGPPKSKWRATLRARRCARYLKAA